MSIDFNGTTAKLEHTTASGIDLATMTIVAWAWADGQGGGSLGRIIQADEGTGAGTTNGFIFCHNNAGGSMRFSYSFNGGGSQDGLWTWNAADNQWNALGISYDRGNVANIPVARVNFGSEAVTTVSIPIGTAGAANTGYCIGNRTGQDRGWDGRIAHLQVFSVILAAAEMDAALRRPGSVQRGLVAWWPLWTETYVNQYVETGPAAGTATSLAIGAGAPCAWPWGAQHGWLGNPGAGAAPPSSPPGVSSIFRQNISGTMRRGSRPLGVA